MWQGTCPIPQAAALGPCSGCVLRGLLRLLCPVATVGHPRAAENFTPNALPMEAGPAGGLAAPMGILAGEAGRQASLRLGAGLEFCELSGRAWKWLGCERGQEMAGRQGAAARSRGMERGDTGRGTGQAEWGWGGSSHFLPGSLAGGLVASGTWERTPSAASELLPLSSALRAPSSADGLCGLVI